jgi:Tol biopolymer transport system component
MRPLVVAAGVLLSTPICLSAQGYFGQNKVVYQNRAFREMHTPHFTVYFYPAESIATADLARMAERWYARHSATMQDTFARKPIIMYGDAAAFYQTNLADVGQGVGGVTEPVRSRASLYYTGIYAETDHVLGHELVHVFQFDIANQQKGSSLLALDKLPQWSIEGMAEYLSIGRYDVNTAMWMRDAMLRHDLPSVKQLSSGRYFPYRYGEALWAYIGGRWGDEIIPSLYRASLRGGLETGIRTVLGISGDSLSRAWRSAIYNTYLPTVQGRVRPLDIGMRLLKPTGSRFGDFDVSPVLSPDGKLVAFYTQRGLFEIDLYVADAVTGRIVKKLTSPNTDSHVDAINFISSAGSWSPDGRKLAVAVFKDGRNEINIYDVHSGHIDHTIKLPGISGLNDMAWGPNNELALGGQHGGIIDLYIYDLATRHLDQVTDTRYAKLQPTWSPDGRYIAYATDSGPGTDLTKLEYSPTRIAMYDTKTRATRLLRLFSGVKHINPQFSPDGADLYFVSDHGGFDDVYKVTLATEQIYQVTSVATGISGITSLSPAISVASRTGRMMLTVFEQGGYALHRIEPHDAPGTLLALTAADTPAVAGTMPPPDVPGGGAVTARIDDATTGLPSFTTFPTAPYQPKFGLEGIAGGGGIGVGTGGYYGTSGTYGYGAGGVAAQFGDILDNNVVIAQIGGAGTLQDFGGGATYINQSHRWNWGATIAHVPYLTGGFTTYDSAGGLRYNQIYERVYDEMVLGFVSYPFSQRYRVEFNTGYQYIHYQVTQDEYFVAQNGNETLINQGVGLAAPPSLSLVQVGMALVGDYASFGFTSPVAGGRWRLEADPTFGQMEYTQVTADYRRYFLINQVTLAFRAIHWGRYGRDADNPDLYSYYLGDPYLDFIRGYDPNTYGIKDCPTNSSSACPSFDRLVGSKVAAANFEIRIPLLGVKQFGLINFPYLPTELAPFFDAGVAWARGSPVTWEFAENSDRRIPVFSSGVSARFNLLGYVVGEIYGAYPFQRPGAGWQFGFNLMPGW